MSGWQLLGALILVALAGAGIRIMAADLGWGEALRGVAFALSTTAVICVAVFLLVGELP